jgi:hypothetical protein
MDYETIQSCLACERPAQSEVFLAAGSFPVVRYRCEGCGEFALSYTLWFRTKLAGWEGPVVEQIRKRLTEEEDSSADQDHTPLLFVTRAEGGEVQKAQSVDGWDVHFVD